MWNLLFTFSSSSALCLCHMHSFSPWSFVLSHFALKYIVWAISRSSRSSYSSISGGDPGPERGWKPSEYRKAFYLFLSIFYSVSLVLPFLHSPSLSLRHPLTLFVYISGDCSKSQVHAEHCCVTSPVALQANRMINLAWLTFTSTLCTLSSVFAACTVLASPCLAAEWKACWIKI